MKHVSRLGIAALLSLTSLAQFAIPNNKILLCTNLSSSAIAVNFVSIGSMLVTVFGTQLPYIINKNLNPLNLFSSPRKNAIIATWIALVFFLGGVWMSSIGPPFGLLSLGLLHLRLGRGLHSKSTIIRTHQPSSRVM